MALLEIHDLTKRFGGLVAVNGVTMGVGEGEIVGLIGPNGSGKSTMVNLVTGVLQPTSGRLDFDGRDITRLPSWRINRLGISRTFQLLRLFPSLTVAQNVAMPLAPRHGSSPFASFLGTRAARIDEEGGVCAGV